jgi:hypothetical protein
MIKIYVTDLTCDHCNCYQGEEETIEVVHRLFFYLLQLIIVWEWKLLTGEPKLAALDF